MEKVYLLIEYDLNEITNIEVFHNEQNAVAKMIDKNCKIQTDKNSVVRLSFRYEVEARSFSD